MEICIISIGKINISWIKTGVEEFYQRISKYIKCRRIIIPDIKNAKSLSPDAQKEEEGRLIVTQLTQGDFVALMDEKGTEFSSREFAGWIQKIMVSGKKRLILIIGGPFGFSEEVYKRANFKIALSKMTFTHEMANLFLTEQLYRAMTILRGEPYHHD